MSSKNNNAVKDFYPDMQLTVNLFQIHTNIVSINTIFLSVKIFYYINRSKNMQLLSTTIYQAREDTMYFILIFVVLIFGFVGMSYLSFGAHLEGYSTIKSALRMNFQVTLGEFDFNELY